MVNLCADIGDDDKIAEVEKVIFEEKTTFKESNLRPCIVTFYNPETKKYDITEKALFYCWGQSFEEFEDGAV